LAPTSAVLSTNTMFSPTAAATPVLDSVLVEVDSPCAVASTASSASTVTSPVPVRWTPSATRALLSTSM
jgi:hypothetical protein